MFILTTIKDLIQIAPQDFDKPSAQAIKDAINTKYSNLVIQNIGLCICLFDLLSASDGLIGHGTGLVNVNVEFRMVVFRPFRGEIVQGRIKKCTEEGITIDMFFTSEIFVPVQNLPENTHFDRGEGVFIWDSDGTELFFDKGEPVLFRVEGEEWIDQKPTVVKKDTEGRVLQDRDTSWRVIASMNQAGLGPTLWWGIAKQAEAEGEDMEVDDEEA